MPPQVPDNRVLGPLGTGYKLATTLLDESRIGKPDKLPGARWEGGRIITSVACSNACLQPESFLGTWQNGECERACVQMMV